MYINIQYLYIITILICANDKMAFKAIKQVAKKHAFKEIKRIKILIFYKLRTQYFPIWNGYQKKL